MWHVKNCGKVKISEPYTPARYEKREKRKGRGDKNEPGDIREIKPRPEVRNESPIFPGATWNGKVRYPPARKRKEKRGWKDSPGKREIPERIDISPARGKKMSREERRTWEGTNEKQIVDIPQNNIVSLEGFNQLSRSFARNTMPRG